MPPVGSHRQDIYTPLTGVAPHSSFLARLAPRPRPRDPRATRPPADIPYRSSARRPPTADTAQTRAPRHTHRSQRTQRPGQRAQSRERRGHENRDPRETVATHDGQRWTDTDGDIYETTERERRRIYLCQGPSAISRSAQATPNQVDPMAMLPSGSAPSSLCAPYSVPLSDTWNMDNT